MLAQILLVIMGTPLLDRLLIIGTGLPKNQTVNPDNSMS